MSVLNGESSRCGPPTLASCARVPAADLDDGNARAAIRLPLVGFYNPRPATVTTGSSVHGTQPDRGPPP